MCIVGAGALGRAVGVPLSVHADVCFLVRPERVSARESWFVTLGRGGIGARRRTLCLAQPERVTQPPEGALIVLAVRVEQLDEALISTLGNHSGPPIVCLTPLLPPDLQRLRRSWGARLVPALVSFAARDVDSGSRGHDGVWIDVFTPPTGLCLRIDSSGSSPELEELGRRLKRSGLRARFEPRVAERNAATTAALFPLTVAVAVAGGLEQMGEQSALLELTRRATRQGLGLASSLGAADSEAVGLARLLLSPAWGPLTEAVRRVAPFMMQFIDEHFGPKLAAQHLALGAQFLELGRERQIDMSALAELLEQLELGQLAAKAPS